MNNYYLKLNDLPIQEIIRDEISEWFNELERERDNWRDIAEKLAGICFDAECLCPGTYEVCGKTFWDKECDIIKCYIDYARKQILFEAKK